MKNRVNIIQKLEITVVIMILIIIGSNALDIVSFANTRELFLKKEPTLEEIAKWKINGLINIMSYIVFVIGSLWLVGNFIYAKVKKKEMKKKDKITVIEGIIVLCFFAFEITTIIDIYQNYSNEHYSIISIIYNVYNTITSRNTVAFTLINPIGIMNLIGKLFSFIAIIWSIYDKIKGKYYNKRRVIIVFLAIIEIFIAYFIDMIMAWN